MNANLDANPTQLTFLRILMFDAEWLGLIFGLVGGV